MAELTLASTELVALSGDAYRGARQRYHSLLLQLDEKPVVAAILASQFSDFYRSLNEGESFKVCVIHDVDQLIISLQVEHDEQERAHHLVVGQRMKLSPPTRLPSRRWLTSIVMSLGPARPFDQERCQEILNQRSSEELSFEVTSTSEVLSRVREELNIAADIQRSFLVGEKELNDLCTGLDLGAVMKPSKEIGGDLYDCIALGTARYLLCIGDVSGKGMPAALTMSTCLTLIRSYSEVIDSPSAIMRRVNQRMCQNNSSCAFTTLFLGVLNIRSGELRYCNAGHNPALILRQAGAIERLKEVHGPAVGVVEGMSYGEARVNLDPEDVLLIYTDGASEMFNVKHQRLGLNGMESVLGSIPRHSGPSIVGELMKSLLGFAGAEYQHDDITLLAARLRANTSEHDSSARLSIAMPNHPAGLVKVKEKLAGFAELNKLSRPLLRKIQVVADELLGNILRYGCSDLSEDALINIHLELESSVLSLQVVDPGKPFNPLESPPLILSRPWRSDPSVA